MIDSGYPYGEPFQRSLLAFLIRHPRRVSGIVFAQFFTTPMHVDIAREALEVYKKHPDVRLTKATLLEFVRESLGPKGDEHWPAYKTEIKALYQMPLPDKPVLLEKAKEFAKETLYRNALVQAERDVSNRKYDAVMGRFLKLRSSEANDNGNVALPVYPLHRFISEQGPVGEEENHLVYPIIPKRGGVLLYGLPKELKSWFAAALALDASCGRKALGFFEVPHPVKTLFVQVEDPEFLTRERMCELTMSQTGRQPFPGMLKIVPRCPLNLMDEGWLGALTRELELFKPELLVLDVLRRLFKGNVVDAKETAEFLAVLDKLRDIYGCAIVLVHHARKGESAEIQSRALGSVNLTAWADVLIYTGGKHRVGTASIADLEIETKSAFLEKTDLDLVVDSEAWPMVQVLQKGKFESMLLQGLIRSSPGLNQTDLERESGIPEKQLRKLLQVGEAEGSWAPQHGDRKTIRYFPSKKDTTR